MRLLVAEFITGGGMANHPLPGGLKQEGFLMLKSVLADSLKIADIELVTTLDSRLNLDIEEVEFFKIDTSVNYIDQICIVAAQCDAAWIIAPESGGSLASIVHRLSKENLSMINCDVQSTRICGDKLKCTDYLIENNLPTISNLSKQEAVGFEKPVVIKNRFGVGCEGLRICPSGNSALEYIDDFDQYVVQPYIKGEHISLSLLCLRGEVNILSCNQQKFIGDEEPRLLQCIVNAIPLSEELKSLANRIAVLFPGLAAYVGVDLIANEDGNFVVDINPRLTSSYVGLSDVLVDNPAELCISTIMENKLPKEIVRNDSVVEVTFE